MKDGRRIIPCIIIGIYVVLGVTLIVLGILKVMDSFWSGMGSALIVVGAVRAIQIVRYHSNEAYREKREVEAKDERNRFIRNKAWAWAGYCFLLIAAICSIVFRLVGQELLSMAASFAVAMLALLYWISYLVLNKKY